MTVVIPGLRKIHVESIPRSLEKAEHYRLLNVPEQAESICLDILAVDPDNQRAIMELVLSLTDQFVEHTTSSRVRDAKQWVTKVTDDYQRTYATGLIHEREGRAYLARGGMSSTFAYESLRDAMDWYEKADAMHPEGNEDAILRWNSCVRTIKRERLRPPHDHPEQPLE
ncbi:MAG: hypothetical protein K0V04_18420 [Deltaproteobacteria bacterium]|nr:hypothetical protein [Deltaproteobacteria bacterium]